MKNLKRITTAAVLTLALGIISTFISCGESEASETQMMQQSFEKNLKPRLNDPQSFEFISFEVLDTLYAVDPIQGSIDFQKDRLITERETLERRKVSFNEGVEESDDILIDVYGELIDETKEDIKWIHEHIAELQTRIDSIGPDKIKEIRTKYAYRAKNGFGALTVHEHKIIFNDTLGIVKVDDI